MCFKAGDDELDTVKNLMTMSLSVVVADALEVDLDEVQTSSRLVQDLGMTPDKAVALKEGIAEYFDGLEIDLRATPTVGALLDKVVLNEFRGMGDACTVYTAEDEEPLPMRKAA